MESNSVGPLTGVAVVYTYDSYLRRTGVTVTTNGVAVAATGYGYDAASRLVLVSNVQSGIPFSATYSYLANSPLVGQIQFKSNTFTAVTTTKNYDALNRLTSIVSTPTGGSTQMPLLYAYQYNAANQRTRCTLYDNSYWLYGYDSLGQVTSGKKYFQDGTPVPGEQFGNAFDDIGNRTATTQGGDSHGGSLRTASYSVNDLNQYTSRTVPNAFDVLGQANVAATVKVNGTTADYRRGEFYQSLFTATNSSAPVWVTVTNTATNSGSYSNVIGNWFIPKTPENFTFDFDGNQTSDGRFTNYWDAENRLLTVSNIASIGTSGQFLVNFAYDYMGRRIQKVVYTNSGSSWIASYTNKFVYDGWNLLAVLDGGNNLLQSFMWGLDLSGSMQGAGGVGGLLSMTIPSGQASPGTYFYFHDGNGNVGGLVNAYNGTMAEVYEYGPFGEVIRATGPMAFINPFRWSTRYQDDETGIIMYPRRPYNPSTGRFLCKDPIEEQGGMNLYEFVANNPLRYVDPLGLWGGEGDASRSGVNNPTSFFPPPPPSQPTYPGPNSGGFGGLHDKTIAVTITYKPCCDCYLLAWGIYQGLTKFANWSPNSVASITVNTQGASQYAGFESGGAMGTLSTFWGPNDDNPVWVSLQDDSASMTVTAITLGNHMLVGKRNWSVSYSHSGPCVVVVQTHGVERTRNVANWLGYNYLGGSGAQLSVWTQYLSNIANAQSASPCFSSKGSPIQLP